MPLPFSLNARLAVFNAQEEARALSQCQATPEHLLLGLLAESEGVAAYLFRRAGVDAEALRQEVLAQSPVGTMAARDVSLSPAAKQTLDAAQDEAAALYSHSVGTEHLLLALVRDEASPAGRLLRTHGFASEPLRYEVAELHGGQPHELAREGGALDPVTRMAVAVLDQALQDGAEEVHLIPSSTGLSVQERLAGALSEAMNVPRHIQAPLLDAVRDLLAGEGGGSLVRAHGKDYDVRFLTLGDAPGEPLILRLLERPGPEPVPEDSAGLPSVGGVPSQRMAPPAGPSPLADVLHEHRLRGRDILGIEGLTRTEILLILDVASRLKANKFDATQTQFAQGQTLAMLFEKPSLRTRVTFEAGMTQLGGHAIYLEGRLGQRESVPDVARNLDRWIDGIMARTFAHQTVTDLADNAGIPVVNGLSDREHPCQALADFQTLLERKGRLQGLTLAYVGDGNNVAHSLALLAAKVGTHFRLACPEGYQPDPAIWQAALGFAAETRAILTLTHDPAEAARDADAVYTDVWASMGQEDEAAERARIFAPFQLNAALMARARPGALVMHCLPAHRGEEIAAEVIDGPQSVVYDQAENRLHAQKAVLSLIL